MFLCKRWWGGKICWGKHISWWEGGGVKHCWNAQWLCYKNIPIIYLWSKFESVRPNRLCKEILKSSTTENVIGTLMANFRTKVGSKPVTIILHSDIQEQVPSAHVQ